MGLVVREAIYKNLQRKIVFIILLVSFIPLIFLGVTVYLRFARVYEEKVADQIKHLARSQCSAVEIFLKERASILSTIVDTHNFDYLKEQNHITDVFESINRRADSLGLVDLGVIDSNGEHLAYAGPYNLKGFNYYKQPWFGEVINKGIYISDVYMGYRQLPHFIIAVRGYDSNRYWILRATIDSDIFNRLVRTAQTGRTGDAYITNKDGVYQTNPRFSGSVLKKSNLDTKQFGEGITLIKKTDVNKKMQYYAGVWLKNNEWLLVISQKTGDEMIGLLHIRNVVISIIFLGCLAIIITTIFASRVMFKRLQEADIGISKLNAQLIQSDKLAALGKMATGVAHEINNPLAVIGEKAGWMRDLLLEEEFQKSENLKEYAVSIDKIEEHVGKARKITHSMLGFARRMEPRLDDVDVNAVLNQTIELVQNHALVNSIEIKKDFQDDLPIIASDQSQLQQVFMNLINNAIDAIEKDGLIEVKTWHDDSKIAVSIKDNGPGIAMEHQGRVFDPFFTTKETGKGTGLGLSISFSIIEKMGGVITLRSEPSKGATFTIKLPVVIPEKK